MPRGRRLRPTPESDLPYLYIGGVFFAAINDDLQHAMGLQVDDRGLDDSSRCGFKKLTH